MQAKYKVALAVVAVFFLGAGVGHGLRAAASPPAYVVAEITVKDEDGYKNDFLPLAQKAIFSNWRMTTRSAGGQGVAQY